MLLSASNASEVGSDRIRERQSAGLESGAAAELPAAGASERRAVREMQWHWVAIMEAHGEWRGIRDEHAVFLPASTGRGDAVMALYNFSKQFVPYVVDGSKTHTVRSPRRYPVMIGQTCHLYTGLRTREAKLLLRAPCVRIEPFRLNVAAGRVSIAGEQLSLDEANAFAYRDGFRRDGWHHAFKLMLQFWIEKHGASAFRGTITHWDYSKAVFE